MYKLTQDDIAEISFEEEYLDLIDEWGHGGITYKAFEVAREAIDNDNEYEDALLLVSINGVERRKIETVYDPVRMLTRDKHLLAATLREIAAPESVWALGEVIGALIERGSTDCRALIRLDDCEALLALLRSRAWANDILGELECVAIEIGKLAGVGADDVVEWLHEEA